MTVDRPCVGPTFHRLLRLAVLIQRHPLTQRFFNHLVQHDTSGRKVQLIVYPCALATMTAIVSFSQSKDQDSKFAWHTDLV